MLGCACSGTCSCSRTKPLYTLNSTAHDLVDRLLEAGPDDLDPKDFALDNKSAHWHPVWKVELKALRAFLRLHGLRVIRMRRRTRGSITAQLFRETPGDYNWTEQFRRALEYWLAIEIGVSVYEIPLIVQVYFLHPDTDLRHIEIDIYKSDIDPKHGDSHPYL